MFDCRIKQRQISAVCLDSIAMHSLAYQGLCRYGVAVWPVPRGLEPNHHLSLPRILVAFVQEIIDLAGCCGMETDVLPVVTQCLRPAGFRLQHTAKEYFFCGDIFFVTSRKQQQKPPPHSLSRMVWKWGADPRTSAPGLAWHSRTNWRRGGTKLGAHGAPERSLEAFRGRLTRKPARSAPSVLR